MLPSTSSPSPTRDAGQLLLVVAPTWESTVAQLQRFSRETDDAPWLPVGNAITVSLGRAGLAWGRGLHTAPTGAAPAKHEGDGRAPAGVFAITGLFGKAPADTAATRALRLPYLAATADLKAIDDPTSAHYNRIVDRESLNQPDWRSCEDMLRDDGRYDIGAIVGHNHAPSLPGAGSCIFLHVWAAPGVPTAGCTAMSLKDMWEIAAWLDATRNPLLVQLPLGEHQGLRTAWQLPEAPQTR